MDRRGFLQAILITGCAPAVVQADSLMRIVVRPRIIRIPYLVGGKAHWIEEHDSIGRLVGRPEFGVMDIKLYPGQDLHTEVSKARKQLKLKWVG